MATIKWQQDSAFTAWLLNPGKGLLPYARLGDKGELKPSLNDAMLIYMHEAWIASTERRGE